MDLFACVRPVRWYDGTPSPVKAPGDVDMIIFQLEDVYAGIEWQAGSEGVKKLIDFFMEMGAEEVIPQHRRCWNQANRRRNKPIVRAALQYAIDNDKEALPLSTGGGMKF